MKAEALQFVSTWGQVLHADEATLKQFAGNCLIQKGISNTLFPSPMVEFA